VPFVDPSTLPAGQALPGWSGRFFSTASMTFASYEIAADAQPLHDHHSQEEVWTGLEGELAFTIDGVERVARPGRRRG
jgi:mannose-6-phosphate isomerase-like protein (cupin superfamily)